ncbi:MAG: AbrB family transcriptional regulator [Synechococcaceae bacterium WB6_3B_236]|nr:AbrB family transcriptional regulator [Synechococcaceae bacterium WB6_3B_236]
MLIGQELLAKVKEAGDGSKSDEALLEAKGVSLGEGSGVGKGGRKLSYVATVQGNGNLLIGKAYTAMLDLKTGDDFEIKLGRKQIRLVPVGGSEEDE